MATDMDYRQKLLDEFKTLPAENERDYELRLTAQVNKFFSDDAARDALRQIVIDLPDSPEVYAAFYALNILYRRRKDISDLKMLFETFGHKFTSHISFDHLSILLKIAKDDKLKSALEIIQLAYQDATKIEFSENAGYQHLFADTVASFCEAGISPTEKREICATWVSKAETACKKAIDLTLQAPYAKYYCTMARLNALQGKYDIAFARIDQAIDLEDASKKDYAIRIGDYQLTRIRIQSEQTKLDLEKTMKEYHDALKNQQEEVKREVDRNIQQLEGSAIKNLEFLGLFAGIVSFTIGSIQIAGGQSFFDAARLVVVLMGALLGAFSGFGFIVNGKKEHWLRYMMVFVLGLIIIAGGALFV